MPLVIDSRLIEVKLRDTWRISRGTVTSKKILIVRLEWEGLVGHGEGAPTNRFGETAETALAAMAQLGPIVAGAGDPRAFRALGDEMERRHPGDYGAKAALEMALHDLAGKAAGVPVWRLLGVDPGTMPVTSFSIGIDEPPVIVEKTRAAAPYAILKVKVGTAADRAIIAAVRSVTDKPVRVDANEGWPSREHALAEIEWLATQGVELVEQPLPAADLAGARWLCERSPIPIVADEPVQRAADVPRLAGTCHGVNIKLMKCGGIQEALRIVAVARAHGLKIMLGCMIETSLGIAAAAQLAPLVDWVDLDGNLLLADDPFRGHPIEGGRLRLLDAPGLGVAVSPQAV